MTETLTAPAPAPPAAGRPVHVLSVQSASLGNVVYSMALREHLATADGVRLESVWLHEDRELATRLLYRALDWRVPSARIGRGNLDVRRARNEAACGLLGRRLVARRIRSGAPPDVLHFHTQVSAMLSVGWMKRIPTVVTADMTAPQAADADPASPAWTHGPSIALERRVFEAAAHTVFFSEWARRSALGAYALDPERTSVIRPGVPVDRFAPRDAGEPKEGRLPVLLFVGNDFERKGGPDLLDVFARTLAGRAELHIATGARLPELPGVVVHRGVRAFTPEWFALYRAADVFVLPTRSEAFGLVYVEAMAAGLPVVGTRINAVPEIVVEGETGLLVPPGDRAALAAALAALVGDAGLRARLGAAGRARARAHFDARASFDGLARTFVEAAGGGAG